MCARISEEELKAGIDYSIISMKRFEGIWNKILPDKIKGAFHALGSSSRRIAVNNMVLGNQHEAVSWFKKSTEYFIKSVEHGRRDAIFQIKPGLEMSVLSRDANQMALAASLTDEITFEKPIHLYHSVLCLGKIIQTKDKEALLLAEKLRTVEGTSSYLILKRVFRVYLNNTSTKMTQVEQSDL
jgi:hypothetical protein